MEATVTLANMKDCIARLSSIPKRAGKFDFMKLVEIKANKNELEFYVSNDEDSLLLKTEATVTAEGCAIINYFWLSSIIKGSKSDLEFSITTNGFQVKSGTSVYTNDLVPATIPSPDTSSIDYNIYTSGKRMVRDLELIRLCRANKDPDVPEFYENFNISSTGDFVFMGASNTMMASVSKPLWNINNKQKLNISIKNNTVDVLKKVVGKVDTDVYIGTAGRQVSFKGDNFKLVSRLPIEEYPNIYKLIPKTDTYKSFELNGNDMFECLKRINTVADEDALFNVKGDKLEISPYAGGGKEVLDISETNDNYSVIVNSKWIESMLKLIKDDKIFIQYGHNNISDVDMLVLYGSLPVRYYVAEKGA